MDEEGAWVHDTPQKYQTGGEEMAKHGAQVYTLGISGFRRQQFEWELREPRSP